MRLKIAALGAKGIPHPGGIELVMEEIGSRLVKKGHQFDVFVRNHYMASKPPSYKGIGLPRSPGLHNKFTDALSHSTTALLQILAGDYDIVYLNSIGLAVLAPWPKIFGKKVVVHTHGLDWKREKWGPVAKKLIRSSAWAAVNLPHATFCVCREDKKFLEALYNKPCVYVPNGIPELRRREPEEIRKWNLTGNDYLLFMARLVPEKGAHFLIKAWQMTHEKLKRNIKLVISGDTNHDDEYYRELKKFETDDIIFTGFATGRLKEELFSNTLCLVQPSTIEGMPLSILEAMGSRKMVLASDIRENQDVLCGNGCLFETSNVDDLSQKIAIILNADKDFLHQEGYKLYQCGMQNNNWDSIVNTVEENLIRAVFN